MTAGYTSIGANSYVLATTILYNPAGLQIVLPTDALITKASAAVKDGTNSHKIVIAIYSDSGGTRGSLVATSAVSASMTTSFAFLDVFFTSPAGLAAGTYWLQVQEGSGNPGTASLAFDTGGGSNTSYFLTDLSNPSYGSSQYSVFLTYDIPTQGQSSLLLPA